MSYIVAFLLYLFGFGAPAAGPPPAGAAVSLTLDDAIAAGEGAPLPAITPARGADPPLVVIDPGHGGRDPGAPAVTGDVYEKEVTLALAKAVRDALAASGRVRAALTREDDRFIPLEQRYEIARRLGADLFISLHADAAQANDQARGATIYTLSDVASDADAADFAARENAAGGAARLQIDPDPGVNLILVDLAQRESMAVSARFAQVLHREGSAIFPFRERWHRFAAFVVLKAPDIPSVLFEAGYVSNAEDIAYLTSDEGRAGIATGLRRAIEAHFAPRFLAQRR